MPHYVNMKLFTTIMKFQLHAIVLEFKAEQNLITEFSMKMML